MSNTLTGTHEIDHQDGSRTFVAEAVDKYGDKVVKTTTLYDSDTDSTRADKIEDTIQSALNY